MGNLQTPSYATLNDKGRPAASDSQRAAKLVRGKQCRERGVDEIFASPCLIPPPLPTAAQRPAAAADEPLADAQCAAGSTRGG